MEPVIRNRARTTAAVRRAIQDSNESLRVLARRYGINPKTAAKWRKRQDSQDLPSGPRPGRHRGITAEEEEIIVRFRAQTLLPLDDCLYALQARIPHLTRSTLHRCFQRHGISRLAETAAEADGSIALKANPVGQLHIHKAEVRTGDTNHYLFNAIDQASKFVVVMMTRRGDAADAAAFLDALIATIPFRIERIFTPDTEPFTSRNGPGQFSRRCEDSGIEHQVTTLPHPWARNRAAGVGKLIEESLTFASEEDLANLLRDFVQAYNFRRRLKALRGRTPFEFVCQAWEHEPQRFLRDPHHEMMRPQIVPASVPDSL